MKRKAYRALLLKYDIMRLPPDVQQKLAGLLKIQEEFRRWASEWAKNNGEAPLPEQNPLKYLAEKFVHAWRALDWLRGRVIRHGMRTPMVFNVQLKPN